MKISTLENIIRFEKYNIATLKSQIAKLEHLAQEHNAKLKKSLENSSSEQQNINLRFNSGNYLYNQMLYRKKISQQINQIRSKITELSTMITSNYQKIQKYRKFISLIKTHKNKQLLSDRVKTSEEVKEILASRNQVIHPPPKI